MSARDKRFSPGRSTGFTYIGILIAVALLGVTLAALGSAWSLQARRAKEQELLHVGQAYRKAIASYYRKGPAGVHQYPRSIDELLNDPRGPGLQRHLRKAYADPMTGRADWRLVKTPDGFILGVASQSMLQPLKRSNFGVWEASFEDAHCLCDWEFSFLPQLVDDRAPGQ
jgi:type II secretory pathway pseudopilin PulG